MKNFELTNETIVNDCGVTLHRIKAVKDIITPRFTVKAGELGGFVEKVDNLADDAWVFDNAWVCGNAWVYGNAEVYGNARVYDNACVYGNALVSDNARIYDDAEVFRTNHYLVVGPIGSRNGYTTFFRSKEGAIKVKCGCFGGTTDEFLDKVEKTHGDSKYAKVYRIATEMALAQIDMN